MKKGEWVVAGGKRGEAAHCTRCGQGLEIGTQLVSVAVAAMKAFIKAHSNCVRGEFQEPIATLYEDWLNGRDTGTSSLTIYAAITGTRNPHRQNAAPRDPDDFGRCYRLLKLFPHWKASLDSVSRLCPEFKPFIENWDKLCAMYEEALAANDGAKLYAEMKRLRAEVGA